MTSPGRGPGRPRDPDVDDAITKAALELFIERGLAGASIEAVAKRAGVAKVTVYRRWSSREDLLTHAIERARTAVPETEIWATASASSNPAEDARLTESWLTTLTDPRFRNVLAQLIGSSITHPGLLNTYRETYIEPRRRAIAAALERARREGTITTGADLDTVIDMVVGASMYRMLIDPAAAQDPDTTRHRLDELLRLADRLLRGPGSPNATDPASTRG